MTFFQKILFPLFLIRINVPLVFTIPNPLIVDSETLEPIRWKDLPEYKEYLKQMAKTTSTPSSTSSTLPNSREKFEQLYDSPFDSLSHLPAIHLCKESPKENNFYGHIYCVAMLFMYILLIFSLVIYLLRSINRIMRNSPSGIGPIFVHKNRLEPVKKQGEDQLDHIRGPEILNAYNKGLNGKEISIYLEEIEKNGKRHDNENINRKSTN